MVVPRLQVTRCSLANAITNEKLRYFNKSTALNDCDDTKYCG